MVDALMTGSGFRAGRRDMVFRGAGALRGDAAFRDDDALRESDLRTDAERTGDLRTDVLRLALAGRFFLTERLFMELTISSKPTIEQKI